MLLLVFKQSRKVLYALIVPRDFGVQKLDASIVNWLQLLWIFVLNYCWKSVMLHLAFWLNYYMYMFLLNVKVIGDFQSVSGLRTKANHLSFGCFESIFLPNFAVQRSKTRNHVYYWGTITCTRLMSPKCAFNCRIWGTTTCALVTSSTWLTSWPSNARGIWPGMLVWSSCGIITFFPEIILINNIQSSPLHALQLNLTFPFVALSVRWPVNGYLTGPLAPSMRSYFALSAWERSRRKISQRSARPLCLRAVLWSQVCVPRLQRIWDCRRAAPLLRASSTPTPERWAHCSVEEST